MELGNACTEQLHDGNSPAFVYVREVLDEENDLLIQSTLALRVVEQELQQG